MGIESSSAGGAGGSQAKALGSPQMEPKWAPNRSQGPDVSFWKNNIQTPLVEMGQKHRFGSVGGHQLAKVLAIRAEISSLHTVMLMGPEQVPGPEKKVLRAWRTRGPKLSKIKIPQNHSVMPKMSAGS